MSIQVSDLGREVLTLLAQNRPVPSKLHNSPINGRVINPLVKKNLASRDSAGMLWITAAGREVVGIADQSFQAPSKVKKEKVAKPQVATCCSDCGVVLVRSTRALGMAKDYNLCSYCDLAMANHNDHEDKVANLGDHAEACRDCETYDPSSHWETKVAERPNAKKTPKVGKCFCPCGEPTKGGNYLPGHDARHAGMLSRSVVAGDQSLEDALSKLPWGADRLEEKVRRSVALGRDKAARAQARARDKATSN